VIAKLSQSEILDLKQSMGLFQKIAETTQAACEHGCCELLLEKAAEEADRAAGLAEFKRSQHYHRPVRFAPRNRNGFMEGHA
jgi:hypothetical protein